MSGDPKALEMGLVYARNVVKQRWMEELRWNKRWSLLV